MGCISCFHSHFAFLWAGSRYKCAGVKSMTVASCIDKLKLWYWLKRRIVRQPVRQSSIIKRSCIPLPRSIGSELAMPGQSCKRKRQTLIFSFKILCRWDIMPCRAEAAQTIRHEAFIWHTQECLPLCLLSRSQHCWSSVSLFHPH